MATPVPPRSPAIPQKESLRDNAHLYECFKTIELWMQQASAWMAGLKLTSPAVPVPPVVLPPPTVTAIAPTNGPVAGSTPVTITGTGFQFGATVQIGGVDATTPVALSPTTITAVTGAHAGGAVDVVVTNPDAQTGTLAGGYTYEVPTVAYILTQTLGTLRNDYDGFVGFYFGTDANTPTVVALGRWKVAGNAQSHNLYLYKLVDGGAGDIQLGTVVVDMSAGSDASYIYVSLPSPVTLEAGVQYYVISQESNGGDEWYDSADTTADSFTSGIGTLQGNTFESALNAWDNNQAAPAMFGPVNFTVPA